MFYLSYLTGKAKLETPEKKATESAFSSLVHPESGHARLYRILEFLLQ